MKKRQFEMLLDEMEVRRAVLTKRFDALIKLLDEFLKQQKTPQ